MLKYFGDREIAICRELTKIHEEVINTTLSAAIEKYEQTPPKGEFVLVIKGREVKDNAEEYSFEEAVDIAKEFMAKGESASSAAKQAASETGYKKSDIYKEICN